MATLGLEAVAYLKSNRVASTDWIRQAHRVLRAADPSAAEVEIAILPAIRSLVRAAGGFVQAHGTRFGHHGRRHLFAGVNFWQVMHMGMSSPVGDRERLGAELDHLKSLGLTNLRILAGAEGPDSEPYRVTPALMTAPGNYDETVLEGLDFVIAELARRDMHAVVVLTNFWEWSGGMAQYVSWHEGSSIPYPATNHWRKFTDYAARFYGQSRCQQWYRQHIEFIVTRVNPLTGRAYRDEPAIFAWELANEPRYYPDRWIDDTARYIKNLDHNHMVTTGSEGETGGPFRSSHDSPAVDYTTVHIWAQNWGWFDPKDPSTYEEAERRATEYLDEHLRVADHLDKPLVLEEFGLARDWEDHQDYHNQMSGTSFRDRLFKALCDRLVQSASHGGSAGGFNVWAWSGRSRPGDRWLGDPPHETPGWYSVYDTDEGTLDLFRSCRRTLGAIAGER